MISSNIAFAWLSRIKHSRIFKPTFLFVVLPLFLAACMPEGVTLTGGASSVISFMKDGNTVTSITIDKNTSISDARIIVNGKMTTTGELEFTITSSNQALLPDSNIIISGNGRMRDISITPVSNMTGETILTGKARNTLTNEELTGSLTLIVQGAGSTLHTETFDYTGDAQSFVVPNDVVSIHVEMWGAGGGAGGKGNANDRPGLGGGGAYVSDDITVIPEETITIKVGGGGQPGISGTTTPTPTTLVYLGGTGGWPDGGNGGAMRTNGWLGGTGGGGGGSSSLFRESTVLLVAGAGGGGGAGTYNSSSMDVAHGGAGGLSGINGSAQLTANNSGGGATPTEGGAAGLGVINGIGGSYLLGANGGTGAGNGRPAGGGGGGGYYGGGSGASGNSSYDCGGGGGGSSYASPTATVTSGEGTTPGESANSGNENNGFGGHYNQSGSNGRVIITYYR